MHSRQRCLDGTEKQGPSRSEGTYDEGAYGEGAYVEGAYGEEAYGRGLFPAIDSCEIFLVLALLFSSAIVLVHTPGSQPRVAYLCPCLVGQPGPGTNLVSKQTNVKTGYILYTWSEGEMKRKVYLSVYLGSPIW